MPKAKLEFNIPDEQYEYECACKGEDCYLVLVELDQELRSLIKYGHGYKDPTVALEAMREQLRTYCIERNIQLGQIRVIL